MSSYSQVTVKSVGEQLLGRLPNSMYTIRVLFESVWLKYRIAIKQACTRLRLAYKSYGFHFRPNLPHACSMAVRHLSHTDSNSLGLAHKWGYKENMYFLIKVK